MKTKIILINLAILIAYMLLLTAASKGAVLFTSILPIGAHVLTNFILFIVKISTHKENAYSYLISAILVLLIGFPSCWMLSGVAGDGRIF